MKGVQCYELFGGIAHKNHAFSVSLFKNCGRCYGHVTIICHETVVGANKGILPVKYLC